MTRKAKPVHQAEDFDLDPLSGDDDLFRWFLLSYLFGKPIQSTNAIKTWKVLVDNKIDNPWAILELDESELVGHLRAGGYTRYQHVTARGLRVCMEQLLRDYEGSLMLMLENSENDDEFSKRLQALYGVGPKIAEIIMRETEEYFARRIE